jgi:hypothetical protein
MVTDNSNCPFRSLLPSHVKVHYKQYAWLLTTPTALSGVCYLLHVKVQYKIIPRCLHIIYIFCPYEIALRQVKIWSQFTTYLCFSVKSLYSWFGRMASRLASTLLCASRNFSEHRLVYCATSSRTVRLYHRRHAK